MEDRRDSGEGSSSPMLPSLPDQHIRGVLSPYDRASEILFGLIMALTITGALNVAQATERETRALFVSTLSCNVAWGLVDAVMYVLNEVFGRARRFLVAQELRGGSDPIRVLSEVLPGPLVATLTPADLEGLRRRVLAHPEIPGRPGLRGEDLLGALGVFLLVVASTFPVALPFLVIPDVDLAMKVSRGLALLMLFLCGFAVGRYSGIGPVKVGLAMLGIGAVLVAVVTALGG
jgi:VIT1/CCC1 family predicted Fe2+/Mn2+ transporter